MMLRVVSAGVFSLLLAGPALAVGPNCDDQIAQIKGQLADHPEAAAEASIRAKVNEAQRLCSEHKDKEAQGVAQQIREQLGQASEGEGRSSGSGTSSGASAPSR
jgi:hypothetical protein